MKFSTVDLIYFIKLSYQQRQVKKGINIEIERKIQLKKKRYIYILRKNNNIKNYLLWSSLFCLFFTKLSCQQTQQKKGKY